MNMLTFKIEKKEHITLHHRRSGTVRWDTRETFYNWVGNHYKLQNETIDSYKQYK